MFPKATRLVPSIGLHKLPKPLRKSPPRIAKPLFEHLGRPGKAIKRLPGGKVVRVRDTTEKRPRTRFTRGIPTVNAWVHPRDRIAQWSITVGDEVRLLAGSAAVKYNNENEGVRSGWKVYKVKEIQQKLNRVLLDGLVGKRSSQGGVKPKDFDSWAEEDQARWQGLNSVQEVQKPVHVSNLGLLVEKHPDDPTQHVFASRLKVSAPYKDRRTGEWRWDRYATALTGQTSIEEDVRGWKIEWPKEALGEDKAKDLGPNEFKAEEGVSLEVTYQPPTSQSLLDHSYDTIIPTTFRAPTPPTWHSDQYIATLSQGYTTVNDALDNLMPFYLSEELSPRFSKAKKESAYKAAQYNVQVKRKAAIEKAVLEWEGNGRDRNLRHVMDSPVVNLAGVPLRYRTRREVEETAALEFDTELQDERKFVSRQLKHGYIMDLETQQWIPGPKQIRIRERREKKKLKAERKLASLERRTLIPTKNMYVPPELIRETTVGV